MRPRTLCASLLLAACAHQRVGDIRPALVGAAVSLEAEGPGASSWTPLLLDAARAYREREGAPTPEPPPTPRFLLVFGVAPDQGRGAFLSARLVDRDTGVIACSVSVPLATPEDREAAAAALIRAILRRPRPGLTTCHA